MVYNGLLLFEENLEDNMAKRTIRIKGDDILRKKCREVTEINDKLKTLLDDMAETMYDAQGVGLAGPQVGILKRICVIDTGEGLYKMINPVILESSGSEITEEGCLSLPGESEYVERPTYVKAKYTNTDGEECIVEGRGLFARCMCHEFDHLDGILYIDKAIPEDELVGLEDDEDTETED